MSASRRRLLSTTATKEVFENPMLRRMLIDRSKATRTFLGAPEIMQATPRISLLPTAKRFDYDIEGGEYRVGAIVSNNSTIVDAWVEIYWEPTQTWMTVARAFGNAVTSQVEMPMTDSLLHVSQEERYAGRCETLKVIATLLEKHASDYSPVGNEWNLIVQDITEHKMTPRTFSKMYNCNPSERQKSYRFE